MNRSFFHTLAIIGCYFLITTGCAGVQERPDWIELTGQSYDEVHFVGISDSDKTSKNRSYPEIKGDALADVLAQFTAYKGVQVKSTITDFKRTDSSNRSIRKFESASRIVADITDTAGLYQKAEWMDNDGTIYVLYAYSTDKRTRELMDLMLNLPVHFENVFIENDRLYFIGTAVSRKDDATALAELGLHAENDAKMQALLYLGGRLRFTSRDLSEDKEESGNKETTELSEATLKFSANFDISGGSFQKEDSKLQKERDGKYHYYSLYSLSADAGKLKKISEYDYFTYYLKTAQQNGADTGTEKALIFGGQKYTATKFTPAVSKNTNGLRPKWLNYDPPDGSLRGVGIAKTPSSTMSNIIAQQHSLVDIAERISTEVAVMIRDYSQANGDEGNATKMLKIPTEQMIHINLKKVVKLKNFVSGDNTCWQLWEYPRDELRSVAEDVFSKINGKSTN